MIFLDTSEQNGPITLEKYYQVVYDLRGVLGSGVYAEDLSIEAAIEKTGKNPPPPAWYRVGQMWTVNTVNNPIITEKALVFLLVHEIGHDKIFPLDNVRSIIFSYMRVKYHKMSKGMILRIMNILADQIVNYQQMHDHDLNRLYPNWFGEQMCIEYYLKEGEDDFKPEKINFYNLHYRVMQDLGQEYCGQISKLCEEMDNKCDIKNAVWIRNEIKKIMKRPNTEKVLGNKESKLPGFLNKPPNTDKVRNGDSFLIVPTAKGEWFGKEGKIAIWNSDEWRYEEQVDGYLQKLRELIDYLCAYYVKEDDKDPEYHCPKCGTRTLPKIIKINKTSVVFKCPECGHEWEVPIPPPPPKYECQFCGTDIPPIVIAKNAYAVTYMCPKCGATWTVPKGPSPPPPPPKDDDNDDFKKFYQQEAAQLAYDLKGRNWTPDNIRQACYGIGTFRGLVHSEVDEAIDTILGV